MRLSSAMWAARHRTNLWCDRRGVSAIEFALIVPVMILLYVGIVETANMLTIYRRASAVASTAADLTAQAKQVESDDIEDIQDAAQSILSPYSTDPLKIVLSSVVADNNNRGEVDWSCANKGGRRSKGSAYPLPAGITEPQSSVIVAEVTYGFTPLVDMPAVFSPGAFDIKRTFYARPRRSLKVEKTDGDSC